jgi:hypothetical protein
MEPKLIKFASSNTVYANQALINYIQTHQAISQEIKEDDNLFFMKDVDFRRDLLTISKIPVNRVILVAKANAIVHNSDLPLFADRDKLYIKNNTFVSAMDEHDDVVFNVSLRGTKYLDSIIQWFEVSQLKYQPRFVHVQDLPKFINNGFILNENTYDTILQMKNVSSRDAARMLDNCDPVASLPYVLYLVYFESGYSGLSPIHQYLTVLQKFITHETGSTIRLTDKGFKIIMSNSRLAERVTSKLLQAMLERSEGCASQFKDYIENINIDIRWKF